MATIRKETIIEACPDLVWEALKDVGAIHTRLAPGFVTDVVMEEGARLVTFGNGMVIREKMISVDEKTRRVAWSATGGALEHHNASAQAIADGPARCRFIWIADVLPDAAAAALEPMIGAGLAAIRQHLENVAARAA